MNPPADYVQGTDGSRRFVKTSGRSCGPCAACCTVTPVAAFKKPARTRCQHQVGGDGPACGSCAIYPDRPQACRVYQCAWLDGYGPDEHRPDLTGVVPEMLFTEGYPFVVTLGLVPGRQRHNRVVRDLISWWRGYGMAVAIERELIATSDQRRTLSNCLIRFSDGQSVRIGGP